MSRFPLVNQQNTTISISKMWDIDHLALYWCQQLGFDIFCLQIIVYSSILIKIVIYFCWILCGLEINCLAHVQPSTARWDLKIFKVNRTHTHCICSIEFLSKSLSVTSLFSLLACHANIIPILNLLSLMSFSSNDDGITSMQTQSAYLSLRCPKPSKNTSSSQIDEKWAQFYKRVTPRLQAFGV